jgi:hypothetical protein
MMCLDRSRVSTVLLHGLPVLLLAGAAAWACVRGTDEPSPPTAPSAYAPDPDVKRIRQRLLHKKELAREVIAGRLTLLQAAARFRDLDRQPPRFYWSAFQVGYPGATDEERHCREVIRYVRMGLLDQPAKRTDLADHLETELQDLLKQRKPSLPERRDDA